METKEAEGDKNMFHFIKINIFGDSGVGKSTFISVLKDKNFEIQNKSDNSLDDSIEISENLVEQKVEKVIVQTSDNKNIPFLIYETNLNYFDTIKANLDTLLIQTECIIIIWDNSNSNTFQNIPNFVMAIISMIKENKIGFIKIYLIQNKANLEFDISKEGESEDKIIEKIEELKGKYKNIINKKISNKDEIQFLLNDIAKYNNSENLISINIMNKIKLPHPLRPTKNIKNTQFLKLINICLIGDSNTGKSTFLKYLIGEFKDNKKVYESNYLIQVDYENVIIKITDAPGKILNEAIFETIYKKCYGFLLFFDVTNENSFKSLEKWMNKVKCKSNGDIIIVANKIDDRNNRKILKGKIKENTKKYKYFECSSVHGINVNEIFNEIVYAAYDSFHIHGSDSCSRLDESFLKSKKSSENNRCCQ